MLSVGRGSEGFIFLRDKLFSSLNLGTVTQFLTLLTLMPDATGRIIAYL